MVGKPASRYFRENCGISDFLSEIQSGAHLHCPQKKKKKKKK